MPRLLTAEQMVHLVQLLLSLLPILVGADDIPGLPHAIQKRIDERRRQIQDASLKILTQNSDDSDYSYTKSPSFQMSENFMHAFRPGTGVGNREDLILDGIRPVELFEDGSFSRWQHMRFNNSDYVLGIGPTYAVLWQKNLNPFESLRFAVSDRIFKYEQGPISDAVMFTHSSNRDVFYVAILTENQRSSFISIYEIIDGRGMMITVIDLVRNPIVASYTGRRLAHVQSRDGGALAVLFPTGSNVKITYQVKGSNKLNHYIKIYYPSAVSMISFKVGEHSYIAVANRTTCDVYKMLDLQKNHLLFERLYFDKEVIGIESFKLGFHRYLAVSVLDHQFLYVWKPGGFFIAQDFHSTGVRQIYSALLPNCRDDVILIFLKDTVSHEFYVWNGQYEQFIPAAIDVPENMLIWPYTITSFSYGSSVYLLFVDHYGKTIIFALDTHLSPLEDPVLLIGKEISTLMHQLQETIAVQTEKINMMSATLAYAVRPIGDQHVTNVQVFRNMFAQEEVHASSFNPTNIAWQSSTLTLAEYLEGANGLEAKIAALEQELNELEAIIPDIVRTDESTVITSRKLLTGSIHAPSISAQSVYIRTVGGINLPELQKQIYRLDKPLTTIMGTLKFKKPLSVTGNLDSETGINRLDFKNVLTTNTEQVSNALMSFHEKMAVNGDLTILDKMNGISVKSEVVTSYKNHLVAGKKIFKGGIVADSAVANTVDGVNIHLLYGRAMTKSIDQTFSARKNFLGSFRTQNVTVSGKINSYDLSELTDNIVRVDVPAGMVSKTFLKDMNIKTQLTVGGSVNGLKIPDVLFLKSRPNVITGRKEFSSTIYVDDVNVVGSVDGLNLPLDVIKLSADEAIETTLYFANGITAHKDITVHGLVDDVDVSEMAKNILNPENVQFIDTAVFTGSLEVLNDLTVNGRVNEIPLYDLASDVVYKGDTEVVIKSRKHFAKLTAESVKVNKVNNYNINQDFVTVQGDQTVHGTKTFVTPVTFTSITLGNDLISGVNISHLYMNRITLSIEEDQSDDLDFIDHLVLNGDLSIRGTFDGNRFPDDFVLGSTEQEISNKVFQGTTYIDNLLVYGDIATATFGGIQPQDFVHQRVTLSGDQVLDGDLYLGNVTAMTVDVFGTVNDIDIVEFANNVMSKTRDQTITAFKEFSGTSTVWKSMTTSYGINGIDLSVMNSRAVKLHDDNVISLPVTFRDGMTLDNLTMNGYINNVNLTQLDLDSVKSEGLHHVIGPTTFQKGFHVDGNIISPNVNGIDISRDILTKSIPQVITGTYTFNSLSVTGNIDVYGHVNGIDLSETAPFFAKAGYHNTIHSDLVFESVVDVAGDLDAIGLVNGLDLKHLEQTVMTKSGEQHMTVHKILRGNVTVYGNVEVSYVNGISWPDFIQDVVRVDVPQSISGPKYFNGDLQVSDQVYVKGFADIDVLNGVKLADFVDQAVYINKPAEIIGTKVFTGPIVISGDLNAELVNNLKLKVDVITIQCGDKDPQVISGQKTFQNLTVHGDVSIGGFVNGYKLPDVVSSTLMLSGDQDITGHKTFQRPLKFLQNIFPVTVNGLSINQELVTLDTSQNIYGNMLFFDTVNVNSDLQVNGLLNGVDLVDFAKGILYKNVNKVVDGDFSMNQAVVHNPVFVDGYVNGIDLDLFSREVDNFWRERHVDATGLANVTKYHCERAQYLHSSLGSSYYMLSSFKLHQALNASADYIETSPEYPYLSLAKLSDSVPVATYQWNPSDRKFQFMSEDPTNGLRRKTLLFAGRKILVQIGSKPRGSTLKIDDFMLANVQRGFKDADLNIYQDAVLLVLLYGSDAEAVCETFVINAEDAARYNAQQVSSFSIEGAKSLVMFNIDGIMYLAVSCVKSGNGLDGSSKILAWIDNVWSIVQEAPLSANVIHFAYHGYHYLAFMSSMPMQYSGEPSSILVYRNVLGRNKFSLFQKVQFDNTKNIFTFEFGGLPDLYLSAFNSTTVQIYILEGEAGFQPSLALHGKCISDVKALTLYSDLYFVVAQQSWPTGMDSTVIYRGVATGSSVSTRQLTCS